MEHFLSHLATRRTAFKWKLRPCFTNIVKVKCTLVQALRLYTGRTAHRGSRGIALLVLEHGTRRSGWSAPRHGRFVPPGKTRYPFYRRLGGSQGRSGQVRKISPPLGFDPRTVQPVAQLLYRLSYPSHLYERSKRKIRVFWVTLGSLVIEIRHFDRTYILHLQESRTPSFFKMKAIRFSETSETRKSDKWCNIPEDLNPQHRHCEKPKTLTFQIFLWLGVS